MITIRPIQMEDVPYVKQLICTVAFGIFGFEGTLEDSISHYTGLGIFKDMDDIQSHYLDNSGIFLVALENKEIIGSGALRKLDAQTAELKRMWLLENFQGKGIGYRIITHLFNFAQSHGYRYIRLQTSPEQTRALGFYRRVGFYEIPCYTDDTDEISMEKTL